MQFKRDMVVYDVWSGALTTLNEEKVNHQVKRGEKEGAKRNEGVVSRGVRSNARRW